jgi:hypothetical protein
MENNDPIEKAIFELMKQKNIEKKYKPINKENKIADMAKKFGKSVDKDIGTKDVETKSSQNVSGKLNFFHQKIQDVHAVTLAGINSENVLTTDTKKNISNKIQNWKILEQLHSELSESKKVDPIPAVAKGTESKPVVLSL